MNVEPGKLAKLAFMSLLAIGTSNADPSVEISTIREAAGSNAASILTEVEAFRSDLGTNNGFVESVFAGGRREISWEEVPADFNYPEALPLDFFNDTEPCGLVFSTVCSAIETDEDLLPSGGLISSIIDLVTLTLDHLLNFNALSGTRLCAAQDSNVMEFKFFVPGSDVPAVVPAFGAVFSDVELGDITLIELFDIEGNLILSRNILETDGNAGLSFCGITLNFPVIHTVRITLGNTTIGIDEDGPDIDVVTIDDVIFGEPVPVLQSLAHTRYRAPGAADIFYHNMRNAVVNGEGECLFDTILYGPGTRGGGRWGVFSTADTGETGLLVQSGSDGTPFGLPVGTKPARMFSPVYNNDDFGLFQMIIRGGGVRPIHNRVLMVDDGDGTPRPVLRKGFPVEELENASLRAFRDVVQSFDSDALCLSYLLLRQGFGPTVPVVPQNDSGILALDHDGDVIGSAAREGAAAFGPNDGFQFGHFRPCLALGDNDRVQFMNHMRPGGGGRGVPAVFSMDTDGSDGERVVAQGDTPPGITGLQFRNFLAVTASGDEPLYRATLQGAGLRPFNNEGIWKGDDALWLREGDPIYENGLFVRRIIRFWPVRDDQMVAQVIFGGPGVTPRNRFGLILRKANGEFLTLLRTGETAPGSGENPGFVGRILRVDVDPINGNYVALGHIYGLGHRFNKMLWVGNTRELDEEDKTPQLAYFKGDTYTSENAPLAEIRSMILRPPVDRTGACGRGLGQAIGANGRFVATFLTNQRKRELLALKPQ